MKYLIVLFLVAVFAITANARRLTDEEPCEPGDLYSDGCNTCTCGENGKMGACTLMACFNQDGTLMESEYKLVKKHAVDASTYEAGEQKLLKKRDTKRVESYPGELCGPGDYFSDGCNKCDCSLNGEMVDCTELTCQNSDGTPFQGEFKLVRVGPPKHK